MAPEFSSAPKRMGRPPKAEAERKRHAQTFRVNEVTRAELQASADANQRSISEEVEQRLLRYADMERLLRLAFGSSIVERYLTAIGAAVRDALGRTAGRSEMEVREAVAAATAEVSRVYCWQGEDAPPEPAGAASSDNRPVNMRDRPPAAVGYLAAVGSLDNANDPLKADQCDERIMNRWTGDGRYIERVRPLKSIMSNSPGDKAVKSVKSGRHSRS